MKRALFLREIHSAMPPQLLALAILLGGVLVTEKIFRVQLAGRQIVLDVLVLILFTLSGFLAGERCFPAELKEGRYFFLASLPLSRGWVWLCIVSARLLAALTAVTLFIAARAPFWGKVEVTLTELGLASTLFLASYLFIFFAGASFSLLFRRLLQAYAVGSLCLITLSSMMLLWSIYGCLPSSMSNLGRDEPDQAAVLLWTAGALLLTLVFAIMSCQFFLRGEVGSTKRLLRSSAYMTLTLAGALLLYLFITTNPLIARIGSSWVIRRSAYLWEAEIPLQPVSADGRHVLVQESLSHRPRFSRITLLDALTGRRSGRWNGAGVLWAGWVGDTLRLLTVNDSPWDHWGLPKPDSVDLISLGLDGREMWRRRFQGVEELAPFPSGQRLLLVNRVKDIGQISVVGERLGTLEELARGSLTGFASLQLAGEAWIVHFNNDPLPGNAWLVTSQARDFVHNHGTFFYALFGNMYGTLSETENALLRKFAPGRKGSFILPEHSNAWFVENGQTLFFVEPDVKNGREAVTLWALSTDRSSRWTQVTTGLSPIDLRGLAIDFITGFAVYTQRDHPVGLYLYDPALGRSIRIADGCATGELGQISLKRLDSLKHPLVEVSCREKTPGSASQRHYVEYQGSGNSKEIRPIPETGSLLYLDETGTEIWAEQGGRIWRSAPGATDQLLWSPGSAS